MADASALLEYLLGAGRAEDVRDIIRAPDVDLHVPALCDVEVLSGIRRVLRARLTTEARARHALEDYRDFPLSRHGHSALLARMFELRANLSAYDATYVVLAEQLDAALLTADDRFARAARAHAEAQVIGV